MRLTRVQLENFKACRSVDLELAPLTVLIGPNNAGKSSVLHAIALAAQSTAPVGLHVTGRLVDLGGGLIDLVHRSDAETRLPGAEVLLTWTEPTATGTLRISPGGAGGMDDQPALRRFRYVGANRHIENSVFSLGVEPASNPRTAQELVDTLAYDDELLSRVSERCSAIFGYGVDKDLRPGRQITLVATSPAGRRNVVNLGTGFIQTVWLLTLLELALTAPGDDSVTPLIGIEEPELHIHPGLQPDIARLLGAFTRAGLDMICTTQSEHLLLALLSLVLEGELAPDQIVVYYMREGEAERLVVDERGRIERGLRGFFEANEEQLRRHIELLKRRG